MQADERDDGWLGPEELAAVRLYSARRITVDQARAALHDVTAETLRRWTLAYGLPLPHGDIRYYQQPAHEYDRCTCGGLKAKGSRRCRQCYVAHERARWQHKKQQEEGRTWRLSRSR